MSNTSAKWIHILGIESERDGMFTRLVQRWSSAAQQRDLDVFLKRVQGMGSEELGILLVDATHVRNACEHMFKVNLLDPFIAMEQDPALIMKLVKVVKDFQRKGHTGEAGSLMVWVHTLRGAVNPDIRHDTRRLWRELCRGQEHIETGLVAFRVMKPNLLPLTDGIMQVPDGFEWIR